MHRRFSRHFEVTLNTTRIKRLHHNMLIQHHCNIICQSVGINQLKLVAISKCAVSLFINITYFSDVNFCYICYIFLAAPYLQECRSLLYLMYYINQFLLFLWWLLKKQMSRCVRIMSATVSWSTNWVTCHSIKHMEQILQIRNEIEAWSYFWWAK